MTDAAELVLALAVARARRHLRAGRPLEDVTLVLDVAIAAAEHVEDAALAGGPPTAA